MRSGGDAAGAPPGQPGARNDRLVAGPDNGMRLMASSHERAQLSIHRAEAVGPSGATYPVRDWLFYFIGSRR